MAWGLCQTIADRKIHPSSCDGVGLPDRVEVEVVVRLRDEQEEHLVTSAKASRHGMPSQAGQPHYRPRAGKQPGNDVPAYFKTLQWASAVLVVMLGLFFLAIAAIWVTQDAALPWSASVNATGVVGGWLTLIRLLFREIHPVTHQKHGTPAPARGCGVASSSLGKPSTSTHAG